MVSIKTILTILAYSISLIGYVPLFPHIGNVPRLVFLAAFAAGIAGDRRGQNYLRAPLSTIIALIFFLTYILQFSRTNVAVPAANILILLLSVRLASEKKMRDYLQICAVSLFALAASSLFDLSPLFLVYLLLMLILVAITLVFLTFYGVDSRLAVSRAGARKICAVSLLMPTASLPLILIFFTILPRTEYPLWNFLNVAGEKVTGLSEKVELGKSSRVGEVRSLVFRAATERLGKNDLYWRGVVLNSFAGSTWVRRESPGESAASAGTERVIRQTIFPEPGKTPYLITLDSPRSLSGVKYSEAADKVYLRKNNKEQRFTYQAESVITDVLRTERIDRSFYLQQPESVSRRVRELAEKISAAGTTSERKLSLLEEFYHKQKLSYSTKNLPRSEDPIGEFLFDSRAGHCEFFASSFALVLRLAGVPARLVGGYYGGDYNELGGFYVVTEDRAHVWVEAFLEGRGWIKVDPSSYAVNFAGLGQQRDRGSLRRIRQTFDAFGYFWNRAVISYDLERQVYALRAAGAQVKGLNVHGTWGLLAGILVAISALACGSVLLKRFRRITVEEQLVNRFRKLVAEVYGLNDLPKNTGLKELADRVDDRAVSEFVDIYGGAVYRDRNLSADEVKQLKVLLEIIHHSERSRERA